MRVLFFSTYEIVKQSGGVESVTRFLYEYLNSNGYSVYLMYWQNHKGLKSELCQVGLPDKCNMNSLCNIDFIKSYLIKNEIDVVINQTAVNSRTSAGCTIACNELKIPLVSVLHNSRQQGRDALPNASALAGLFYEIANLSNVVLFSVCI